MIEIKINANEQNKRIDNLLKKYLKNAPLSFIYKLFRKKDVKVANKPVKMDYITKENDVVFVYITKEQEQEFINKQTITTSKKRNFQVIYEDDNVLIVNKEAKLLVHDGEDGNEDTLTKQVLDYLIENKSYDIENEKTFVPALAHRIDRNTSGIVVIGKNLLSLQELFKAFKDHGGIEKNYSALVCGKVLKQGVVDVPLIKDEKRKIVNVDKDNGLSATSIYEPLEVFEDVSLLKVSILTGRTHQIRVHMNYINHPLVGDKKYGNKQSDILAKKYKMSNYFLHARKICFKNLTGNLSYLNNKEFIAPYFKWQENLLERINNHGKLFN